MTAMDFPELLRQRRTIRLYQQRPVSDDDLKALLEAARHASCATNRQLLRYVVARTPETVARILPHTAWAAMVAPHRTPQPGVTAPAAFILVTAPADTAPGLIQADAGAAIQSIEFAAADRGLGCCWIGSIHRDEIRAIVGLPADRQLLYAVSVGHPAESPVHEDSTQVRYYLDDADVLHIPKLTVEAISTWL